MSRPSRARGLKLDVRDLAERHDASRPSRARGLKHWRDPISNLPLLSRPSRARGLKLAAIDTILEAKRRALHGRVD